MDFIDVLFEDGVNKQARERRLPKNFFACSFGLKTRNLFVKTKRRVGRGIPASLAQGLSDYSGAGPVFFWRV